jgi:ABC-type uncharacterized transport system permease subunit
MTRLAKHIVDALAFQRLIVAVILLAGLLAGLACICSVATIRSTSGH